MCTWMYTKQPKQQQNSLNLFKLNLISIEGKKKKMRNCFVPNCDAYCKKHGINKRMMFSAPKVKYKYSFFVLLSKLHCFLWPEQF